jgi:hypothetical protein
MTEKSPYEAPVIEDLGGIGEAEGSCLNGSAVAYQCTNGGSADGGGAGGCSEGNSAGGGFSDCIPGNSADKGGVCLAGNSEGG